MAESGAPCLDEWTYGLTGDRRGVAELRNYDLLAISKRPVSEDFGWRRVRNTYTLRLDRLDETPTDGASPTRSAGPETNSAPASSRSL